MMTPATVPASLTLARAAQTLDGIPFRLHGRDPLTGLDCIGVLTVALSRIGRPVALPNGYRLRNRDPAALLPEPLAMGFSPGQGAIEPGDVLLLQPGPAQFHLAIALEQGRHVHAHAGIGRVVTSRGELPWPVFERWRLLGEDRN